MNIQEEYINSNIYYSINNFEFIDKLDHIQSSSAFNSDYAYDPKSSTSVSNYKPIWLKF